MTNTPAPFLKDHPMCSSDMWILSCVRSEHQEVWRPAGGTKGHLTIAEQAMVYMPHCTSHLVYGASGKVQEVTCLQNNV